jgi:hypothetical protein
METSKFGSQKAARDQSRGYEDETCSLQGRDGGDQVVQKANCVPAPCVF